MENTKITDNDIGKHCFFWDSPASVRFGILTRIGSIRTRDSDCKVPIYYLDNNIGYDNCEVCKHLPNFVTMPIRGCL